MFELDFESVINHQSWKVLRNWSWHFVYELLGMIWKLLKNKYALYIQTKLRLYISPHTHGFKVCFNINSLGESSDLFIAQKSKVYNNDEKHFSSSSLRVKFSCHYIQGGVPLKVDLNKANLNTLPVSFQTLQILQNYSVFMYELVYWPTFLFTFQYLVLLIRKMHFTTCY